MVYCLTCRNFWGIQIHHTHGIRMFLLDSTFARTFMMVLESERYLQLQECIPVGFILTAAIAISGVEGSASDIPQTRPLPPSDQTLPQKRHPPTPDQTTTTVRPDTPSSDQTPHFGRSSGRRLPCNQTITFPHTPYAVGNK